MKLGHHFLYVMKREVRKVRSSQRVTQNSTQRITVSLPAALRDSYARPTVAVGVFAAVVKTFFFFFVYP